MLPFENRGRFRAAIWGEDYFNFYGCVGSQFFKKPLQLTNWFLRKEKLTYERICTCLCMYSALTVCRVWHNHHQILLSIWGSGPRTSTPWPSLRGYFKRSLSSRQPWRTWGSTATKESIWRSNGLYGWHFKYNGTSKSGGMEWYPSQN